MAAGPVANLGSSTICKTLHRGKEVEMHTAFQVPPRRIASAGACIGFFICTAGTIAAQQVPSWNLLGPDAKYAEPFNNVRGLRELSDGRLIVLDLGELYIVNPGKGVGAKLGRSGDGPGEYRMPLRLLAFPGDTTAYFDMARPHKVRFILPSGEIRGGFDVASPSNAKDPEAVDGQGRLYSQYIKSKGSRDSADIMRWDPATGRRDTAASLRSRSVSSIRVSPGPGLPPFATFEQWAVSADGSVAVVSVEPFRVTLVDRNGKRIIGPELPYERLRVTDSDRREWVERAQQPVPALVSSSGGPMVATFMKPPFHEPGEWPRYLPPFLPKAASFAPDGMLWIQRTTPAGAPPQIDVIDRNGVLVGQLLLPMRTILLGHGAGVVYLARLDDDDLQYLERYRLPVSYQQSVSH